MVQAVREKNPCAAVSWQWPISVTGYAYATHQLEAGMHILKLQYQLGHRFVHTTSRYVHWVPNYREESEAGIDLIAALEQGDE